ncbi:MAG: hypothetical protein V1655_03950 [bacterium]
MSLVFSAITPHSPILIHSIGKDDFQYLKKTIVAFSVLEDEIYVARPQTIIILSFSEHILNNAFSINLSPKYKSNFKNFGEYSIEKEFINDVGFTHHIREKFEGKIPVKLFSEENLNYEASVPLHYLTEHLKDISIIPIISSGLDIQCHFNFGQNLKDLILSSNKRIAIIASIDLAECEAKGSPDKSAEKGSQLNKKITHLIKSNNSKGILRIKEEIIKDTGLNDFSALLMLLGVMDGINYKPEILSYEFPFGIGYLTANLKLG